MLRVVKVRIYPTQQQETHLAQAFGCVRWVWNQSLATMSQTYKDTGKGISALAMKKMIPVWKTESERRFPPQAIPQDSQREPSDCE